MHFLSLHAFSNRMMAHARKPSGVTADVRAAFDEAVAALRTNAVGALQLGYMKAGPSDAHAIAAALESNASLTHLNLKVNCIGDRGARDIAAALSGHPSLARVDLMRNGIGDKGATHLAAALEHSGSVETLSLRNNKIGDRGATKLAAALRSNTALR